MDLQVKMPDSGKIITLHVSEETSITELFELCRKNLHIQQDFRLLHAGKVLTMNDKGKLADFQITKGHVMQVAFSPPSTSSATGKDSEHLAKAVEVHEPFKKGAVALQFNMYSKMTQGGWICCAPEGGYPPPHKKSGTYCISYYKDIGIPALASFEWNPVFLETVHKKKKEIFEATEVNKVEQDRKDSSQMILASKHAKWQETFSVLSRKPFLVNAIPEERSWSALHQAVFHNSVENVNKLLEIKNCDSRVKAKQDKAKCGVAGDTPLKLAKRLQKNEIAELLKNHSTDDTYSPPTFISEEIGLQYLKEGVPYFLLSTSFLAVTAVEAIRIENSSTFSQLTEKVFKFLSTNWVRVRDSIAETIYPFDPRMHTELKKSQNLKDFCKAMICIYTTETVYRQVNSALRRASEILQPTGDDLLLGLYSLFLQSILTHWEELKSFKGVTYRGMTLDPDQIEHYQVGKKFVWLQFTSSSTSQSVSSAFGGGSGSVLFTINNREICKSSPKQISRFSQFQKEDEVLYPAVSMFCITDVKKSESVTKIYMDLVKDPSY